MFIGTIVTDTIQLYTAIRKSGWDVPVVGNMVVLHPLIAASADGGMEGLYSAGPVVMADLEEDSEAGQWRRDWHAAYRERFNEDANIQAQVGYVTADLMIKAMESGRSGSDNRKNAGGTGKNTKLRGSIRWTDIVVWSGQAPGVGFALSLADRRRQVDRPRKGSAVLIRFQKFALTKNTGPWWRVCNVPRASASFASSFVR